MDSSEHSDSELIENFQLQLSEIEMLNSMYPNHSEFNVTLPSILADMNNFIEGKTRCIPNELDFTLNLEIPDVKEKVEVNVTFPHHYPTQKPSIYCRSIGLSRDQQKELNCAVKNYVNTFAEGELCIISLISWLSENAGSYFSLQSSTTESEVSESETCQNDILCRLWVYSHHIYNKFKRREIVDSAQSMKLTGFSLPGKPGFICIEGTKQDCNEFLQNVKQMSWKKLSLVKEEIECVDSNSSDFRKFENFQEICFQVRRGPSKEYHMDMGQFLKYLEEHGCAHAFHDLFGLEGHTSDR